MKKDLNLTFSKIPTNLAEAAFKRISSFIEHFHNEKIIEARILTYKANFDLKELCLSCYTQGLLDAQQLKGESNEQS